MGYIFIIFPLSLTCDLFSS